MAKCSALKRTPRRARRVTTTLDTPSLTYGTADEDYSDIPSSSSYHDSSTVLHYWRHEQSRDFTDHYDLPAVYDKTVLTLVARDPHWIYAYWEISPNVFEELRRQLGDRMNGSRKVLRMYDVSCIEFNGSNAHHQFDLDVGDAANWYVNLWNDCVSYCGEIGIRTADGAFYAFARSNTVTTPRASSSPRRDEIWMDANDAGGARPFAIAESGRNCEEKTRSRIRRISSSERTPAYEKAHRKLRRIYLTEDDIRAYYARFFSELKELLAKRLERRYGGKYGGLRLRAGRTLLEDLLLGGASKDMMRKLLGSSAELGQPGASESLVGTAGASETLLGGGGRKFFFEIGTELIVYGRTEPDAEVWLGDAKVALRPDGTFTMRFALPDGRIPLDFTAKSNDKVDIKKIVTAVERQRTQYDG